ncbi:hypothetical protein J6590_040924 [Homalodisca vitripennis]|nr:hypothetical protein J6590_040924 [Homalodisca vitripennis]
MKAVQAEMPPKVSIESGRNEPSMFAFSKITSRALGKFRRETQTMRAEKNSSWRREGEELVVELSQQFTYISLQHQIIGELASPDPENQSESCISPCMNIKRYSHEHLAQHHPKQYV